MKHIYLYILISAGILSCKPKVDELVVSKGNADFTRYVAIGNSLTAGYADGALYRSGQINSYPNMLAGQFALVGGGEFKQPLMPDDIGVGLVGLAPYSKFSLALQYDCKNVPSLSPIHSQVSGAGLAPITNGPFQNLGVPGAKSFHLLTPLLHANPFYNRFASSASSTVLGDAMAQNPTFFTLWIGSNDVLLYAVNGGEQGGEHITDKDTFDFAVGLTMSALTSNGAKGAVANIPDLTSLPYFTTVPYNGLALSDPAQVTALNAAYAPLHISFSLGQNPFIIADPASPKPRQIKPNEYILLSIPQDSIKCRGWGSQRPIPHIYVLDEKEIAAVQTATNNFNTSLANHAKLNKLALVDMNTHIKELAAGITYDGLSFNAKFVSGGAFSLDGIHLNPRGYALVANYYLQSINQTYGASIPLVEVTKYPGILFP